MAKKNMWGQLKRDHVLSDTLVAAVAVSNSTTETTILESGVLQIGTDIHLGLNFFIEAYGTLTTIDSVTGNDLDFAVKYGTTDITQAEQNNLGTNASIIPWYFLFGGRIHTTGSSGKVVGAGLSWIGETTPKVVSTATVAAGTSVDLSVPKTLTLTMQWGTADASNLCTVYAARMRFDEGV